MSATNRKGLVRHEHDFYETPAWAVDLVLDLLGVTPEFDGYVIDPGCGDGAIAQRVAERAPKADVRGIEQQSDLLERAKGLRTASVAWELGDWLTWQPDGVPDLIIGNPPYKDAERFVRKALAVSAKRATVAMLLRQGWVSGKKRRAFWTEFKADFHPLERRPSFNGSGTDATDYSWFVFGPKRVGRWSILR